MFTETLLPHSMRTALISDIHGHFEVLQAVLRHIATQACDRILCLGDIVDGAPHNSEVIRLLRSQNIPTVRGNHDADGLSTLTREENGYLRELPEFLVEDDVVYTHVSPRRKQTAIKTDFDAWNVFDDTAHRLIFIGHLHVPTIWGQKYAPPVSAMKHEFQYGEPFALEPDNRYVICAGAVGQTRDWCPWPRYAIYDSEAQTVTFYAPEVN